MGSASEIDGADCASWFEAEGISHPFRQSIETLPGRKAEIYRVRIGCSKRPSNEAAGESKPEAYPLGRTVRRIRSTTSVRAAESVRRPGPR